MTKEIEHIELSKDAFDFVMKACEMENIHCSICKVKITKDNFGLISKDIQLCNNIACLICGYDELL